jgi:hypothetical protein
MASRLDRLAMQGHDGGPLSHLVLDEHVGEGLDRGGFEGFLVGKELDDLLDVVVGDCRA